MEHSLRLAVAWMVMGVASCALMPQRAAGQSHDDPLANVPKLLQNLDKRGFEAMQGRFMELDPVKNACSGKIPSAWYNNVQPYLTVALPGRVDDPVPANRWEKTVRSLPPAYLLRQDEAVLLIGTTPPPVAYYSFQTFLFMRYNPETNGLDPATGGFFKPYGAPFAYLGDTVNSLTVQTTGSTPYNRPIALLSTGNRKTLDGLRAALRASGYADAIVNTETLPQSLLRFGYENADQFIFLMRTAVPLGDSEAVDAYRHQLTDPVASPMRIFRVRPKVEFPVDPLPAPVLRTRGTGRTEMDLYPTMEKLRTAILSRYSQDYDAEELDSFLPDSIPEGYPAIQRGIAYMGAGKDGSAGYGRDANYWLSPWFDLPDNAFAIVYGLDHAATGKATYSSADVYLDEKLAAGVSNADSSSFASFPHTASAYLPGGAGIEKFYVWRVARNCDGALDCLEAKVPADKAAACEGKIAANARARVGFRQYAEPATKTGPAEAELVYDRVILFRPK
jgi:hypothetical protein